MDDKSSSNIDSELQNFESEQKTSSSTYICPFVVVTYEHEYQSCNVTQKDNNFFTGPRNYAVFVAKTSKYTLFPTTAHTLYQGNRQSILLAINCNHLVSKNDFN